MQSPQIFGPLTKLQCCPTSDGAAAAIICSEDFVHRNGLEAQAVEILGMEMCTDLPSTFKDNSCMKIVSSSCSADVQLLFSNLSNIPDNKPSIYCKGWI